MKPIKNRILSSFLVLIIVIPLVTLLFFNIAMRIYVNNKAKNDLTNTILTMDPLIKKELIETLYEKDQQIIDKAFSNINGAIRASRLAANTELLLFNKNSEVIYFQKTAETFINNVIIEKAKKLLPNSNIDQINTIRNGTNKFFVVSYKLTKLPISNAPYIVYVSSLNSADSIIRTINLILLIIMMAGISIGIIIANMISNHISKPVKELGKLTERIGNGEFVCSNDKTDILELSQLSNSINNMSKRLLTYDNAQKAFIQNLSHELRTPLMSIQGYAEGIINDVLPDTKHAAEIINSESKRINTLVDELLTLSRIENQTYIKQMERLNLRDMLKEYLQTLEGFALKEDKQIISNIPNKEIFTMANDVLLSQAIINISSNCTRHAKKEVTISLSEINNTAVITIEDDGNGINESDLPHIFERFYKGVGGNHGLGLAIAKSAIEFMNGNIEAKNKTQGAQFIITLPIC